MGLFLSMGILNELSSQITAILIPVFVNGTILFFLMSVVIARLDAVSSACRHRMWFFVLCGIFVLASFSEFFPHFGFSPLEVPVYKEVSFIPYDSRLLSASEVTQNAIQSQGDSGSFTAADERYYPDVKHPDNSFSAVGLKWSSLAVPVWFSGMALVLLRIIVGRIGLFYVSKNATPSGSTRTSHLLEQAASCLHLTKKIDLRVSKRCIVPFTFSILRPIILLPQNVDVWPGERLRVVLLHELAHIKRMDHITRGVARLACVLFWFIPVIWILHRNLQREEENACDAMVVNSNVKPADYAKHIIDIVRLSRGRVLLFGLDHALVRKGMLEKRITGILTLKKKHPYSRRIFKTRFLSVFLSCLLLLLLMRPVSAVDHQGILHQEAPLSLLYGKWVNPDYDSTWKHGADCINKYAKLTVDQDGNIHFFQNTFTQEYSHIGETGTWEVTNSWIDSTGDNWYEVKYYYPPDYGTYYYLWKIDKSGTVLEIMYHYADYPQALDRGAMEYRIYDRL